MGALDGMRILVPESRELDLFANMLEAEGAVAVRCPLVRILDLEDTREAEVWIERLIGNEFEDVIWLTGEGLRRLLVIAERRGLKQAFIDAVARIRSITRGPKPVRALREIGLAPQLAAPEPTSQGVLAALAGENIAGRSIGLQLYPHEGAHPLLESLGLRGARVFAVTPYRYLPQSESAKVTDAIRELAAGRIDMIAFTSSPQVDRLMEVAGEAGLAGELIAALGRVPVAAVGPIVEEKLRELGVAHIVMPENAFHLKPLVRAIAAAKSAEKQDGAQSA
jgi:uroporphyrinogen-III synthase